MSTGLRVLSIGYGCGEPLDGCRVAPLAGDSSEPLAEGIHKDTDGPGQASEAGHVAHLPGRHLAPADFGMSASRLGRGPRLLSGRTLLDPGEGAEEGLTSM